MSLWHKITEPYSLRDSLVLGLGIFVLMMLSGPIRPNTWWADALAGGLSAVVMMVLIALWKRWKAS